MDHGWLQKSGRCVCQVNILSSLISPVKSYYIGDAEYVVISDVICGEPPMRAESGTWEGQIQGLKEYNYTHQVKTSLEMQVHLIM